MANWLDKYEQGGMVLKQKTKDNYGKKANPNNPDVSLPPGFKGLAYNTKGRNYSPAWGGQFAMGGSLPGAVGFTYARTVGAAPSNGPYAKKTKASAQNGKEMKYYQEGLDFKPKTISQDGSEIPVDPEGYWNPDNWGNPVIIPSNEITMEGVDVPLIGISDTGDTQMMYPGEDYTFDGESVTEYPVMQQGGRTPIYTDNPRDPRLRAYQDSLKLHNLSLKIANRPNGDISYGRKPEGKFSKTYPAAEVMEYFYPVTPDEIAMSKLSNKSKILPTRHYPGEGGGVHFKKPVQPVVYKKPEPPTVYVDDLDDPRLKAYNDSLYSYNTTKQYEGRFPVVSNTIADRITGLRTTPNPMGHIPIGWYKKPSDDINTDDASFSPKYKKPVQPVVYKKPEPKKEVKKPEPVKKEQPKPIERKQNIYEGSPVYSPGAGIGMGSALIGFVNQKGDTTYIKPEDYERFAVPKYGKAFIESKMERQRNGGVNNADAQPIKKLDQLLNFTNYNKPTKGGWLDKYN